MTALIARRDILAGMTAMAFIPEGRGIAMSPSKAELKSTAVRLGTAVRPEQLVARDNLERTIRRDCSLLVPEYHGQWSAVEWNRGEPWYGNLDLITAFARKHDMMVRGHSLLWEQMTPQWARDEMTRDRSWSTVERHFASLLPRYRGKMREWIVVNEMIDTEDGHRGIRRNSMQRAYGNDYIRRALETAHVLDPDAKLMINEFSIEHDNPGDESRRNALLRLVEKLKTQGAPLHMVGIQGHLELAKGNIPQKRMSRFLSDLVSLEVEVAVTELDVLEDDRSLSLDERDRRVADLTASFLDVALDQPKMTSVVTWSMSDRHSWLQEKSPETEAAMADGVIDSAAINRGLPYDANLTPKPMNQVIQAAIAKAGQAGQPARA
ncbi:endo-1,4-beta-xylanase [Novosphingobium sp. PS1R-30]|uniref:Beta-xylanase n=1 Tax=Novosphingobium anseongense TaxID=3133436 RepID=A0ABU8RUG5_9SPHN